jgi:hypothetical protein
MKIVFPRRSVFDLGRFAVTFPVEVDGAPYNALVSVEALQDHFGLPTTNGRDAVATFETHRAVFERRVEAAYSHGARGDVSLTSHDFR